MKYCKKQRCVYMIWVCFSVVTLCELVLKRNETCDKFQVCFFMLPTPNQSSIIVFYLPSVCKKGVCALKEGMCVNVCGFR